MSFGDSVRALLDTYANCVLLLKSFGRSRKDDGAIEVRQRSRLRKTLKTDRLLVEQAYSSKLSESGSRFVEGDGKCGPLQSVSIANQRQLQLVPSRRLSAF